METDTDRSGVKCKQRCKINLRVLSTTPADNVTFRETGGSVSPSQLGAIRGEVRSCFPSPSVTRLGFTDAGQASTNTCGRTTVPIVQARVYAVFDF